MLKTPLIVAGTLGLAMTSMPAYAEEGTQKVISVDYSDLNLSTEEGQDQLKSRISRAAYAACEANEIRTGTRIRSAKRIQCVKEAKKSVEAQVAAKIEKAALGG